MIDHAPGDALGVADVLGAALGREGALVVVVVPAVEAEGVDSAEVEQEEVQVLLLREEASRVVLELLRDIWDDIFLGVENF